MKMATFLYECPGCGYEYELRKRVTLTRRRCDYCGVEITPAEIDRQESERESKAYQKTSTETLIILALISIGTLVAFAFYLFR